MNLTDILKKKENIHVLYRNTKFEEEYEVFISKFYGDGMFGISYVLFYDDGYLWEVPDSLILSYVCDEYILQSFALGTIVSNCCLGDPIQLLYKCLSKKNKKRFVLFFNSERRRKGLDHDFTDFDIDNEYFLDMKRTVLLEWLDFVIRMQEIIDYSIHEYTKKITIYDDCVYLSPTKNSAYCFELEPLQKAIVEFNKMKKTTILEYENICKVWEELQLKFLEPYIFEGKHPNGKKCWFISIPFYITEE